MKKGEVQKVILSEPPYNFGPLEVEISTVFSR